jgi:hypothetical protein
MRLKKAMVIPIYKGGDCSLVSNYRPVSLTSVVSKQMEHVIGSICGKSGIKRFGYLRVNTDCGRDFHAKVKYLRFARTLQTPWRTEVGQTLL